MDRLANQSLRGNSYEGRTEIDPIPSCSGMDRLANLSLRGNSYQGITEIDLIPYVIVHTFN
jgi:hypothetical protein